MNEMTQETPALAQIHAQVNALIATFKRLTPNWSSRAFADSPDAERCWCLAEDAWETHYAVLEHLHTATAPATPKIVRLTLFTAAADFARDVEGELEPGLLEAGQTLIQLARQLANDPPIK